ncbi:hypothetical protein C8J35_102421 [Rhizobium sp. PP-F2F-G38]|uniref:hypothetical protein n=1 Tax=Rhizobium sp. PP-CC-3G-465 TaxID=2135648 RepID=UPI000D899B91|nr:hypothetical protein C8J37_102421 [Rhizobium sp. PP-WC-1G-195]PYE99532.1 hypothetical protein C8J35_102421 [Rhizobium sp. PP-F2F-G38]TCQ28958.1 hypothetical protein C8J33_1011613 [Rhizobium sp. PP-CC-3G-465]
MPEETVTGGPDADDPATAPGRDVQPVMSQLEALQALQDALKGRNIGHGLVSEELIAERRAEAAADERDNI